jgi:murein L,D-transpeptidase YcbB/YkuD
MVHADGVVQFRDDIYNRDGLGASTASWASA